MNAIIKDYIQRWVREHRVYKNLYEYRQDRIIKYYCNLNEKGGALERPEENSKRANH